MKTKRPNGSLYTRISERVATIEFGHPASNSFVSEMLDRLANEFLALSIQPEVGVIVLRSEGDGSFCAGASLDELLEVTSLEEGKAFFGGFAKVLNTMRSCTKPIICRVQGKTVGGGVGLIAACDYVFASEVASIRLSELSIGIAPLVIAPAVERKTGKNALAELALDPTTWKSAYWALENSLYTRVFESIRELDKELDFFATRLAATSPAALEAFTRVLWEGTDHWDRLLYNRAALTAQLALSPQTREALEKFRNR